MPTRLNPPAILDTIITSLSKFYEAPVTKPPIMSDNSDKGKPSDHLIVLWKPVCGSRVLPERVYRTIETRPLTQSGILKFSEWIQYESWHEIYQFSDVHTKASKFQNLLLKNILNASRSKYSKFLQKTSHG